MWKSVKIYNSLNNSTLLISIEIIQCIIYIYIEILYTCIGFGIYRCYIYSIIYFIKIVEYLRRSLSGLSENSIHYNVQM